MLKGDVRMNSECNKRACISGGGKRKGDGAGTSSTNSLMKQGLRLRSELTRSIV